VTNRSCCLNWWREYKRIKGKGGVKLEIESRLLAWNWNSLPFIAHRFFRNVVQCPIEYAQMVKIIQRFNFSLLFWTSRITLAYPLLLSRSKSNQLYYLKSPFSKEAFPRSIRTGTKILVEMTPEGNSTGHIDIPNLIRADFDCWWEPKGITISGKYHWISEGKWIVRVGRCGVLVVLGRVFFKVQKMVYCSDYLEEDLISDSEDRRNRPFLLIWELI